MKKIILFIGVLVVGVAGTSALYGFYPVALVNKKIITQRTFQKAESAAGAFTNTELQKTGMKPIDFSSSANVSLRRDLARGVLTFLVEDYLVEKGGKELIQNFDAQVQTKVEHVLAKGKNIENAAKLVYGTSLNEFRTLVLRPQARRDVVAETLEEKDQDFFDWLLAQKKNASVRLIFVDFRWTGEKIE